MIKIIDNDVRIRFTTLLSNKILCEQQIFITLAKFITVDFISEFEVENFLNFQSGDSLYFDFNDTEISFNFSDNVFIFGFNNKEINSEILVNVTSINSHYLKQFIREFINEMRDINQNFLGFSSPLTIDMK